MVTYRKFKAGSRFYFVVEGEISANQRGRKRAYERVFRTEKDALANARMWNGIEKKAAHERDLDRAMRERNAQEYLARRAERAATAPVQFNLF